MSGKKNSKQGFSPEEMNSAIGADVALAQAEAPKPEKLRSSMPFTVQSSVLQVKIFTGRDIGEQKAIKVGQATIKISDELKEGLVVYAGHGICEMDVRPAPILKLLIELTGRQTGEELIWAAALTFLLEDSQISKLYWPLVGLYGACKRIMPRAAAHFGELAEEQTKEQKVINMVEDISRITRFGAQAFSGHTSMRELADRLLEVREELEQYGENVAQPSQGSAPAPQMPGSGQRERSLISHLAELRDPMAASLGDAQRASRLTHDLESGTPPSSVVIKAFITLGSGSHSHAVIGEVVELAYNKGGAQLPSGAAGNAAIAKLVTLSLDKPLRVLSALLKQDLEKQATNISVSTLFGFDFIVQSLVGVGFSWLKPINGIILRCWELLASKMAGTQPDEIGSEFLKEVVVPCIQSFALKAKAAVLREETITEKIDIPAHVSLAANQIIAIHGRQGQAIQAAIIERASKSPRLSGGGPWLGGAPPGFIGPPGGGGTGPVTLAGGGVISHKYGPGSPATMPGGGQGGGQPIAPFYMGSCRDYARGACTRGAYCKFAH